MSIQKGKNTRNEWYGCHNKRYACAIALAEKFECNTCMIEKGKMKNILPLMFLLTYKMTKYMEKGKKSDVPDENLFTSMNKMSKKVMVFIAVSWYNATKPFFC